MHILNHLSVDTFLNEYWQKKPVLIRNAFPNFVSPIEADDLAGLALEEEAESRIIIEQGDTPWQLLNGPFEESSFESLPPSHWTLLVQAVDQWIPEMADLLNEFRFLPSWLVDDIMVSFAPQGGSVGPHYDHYDVFLLQAQGQRKWQVGPKCDENTPRRDDTSLRILQEMNVEQEWILEPGDMLYIPPLYAHNGVALNDCMTFSIGFRTPSVADTLAGMSDQVGSLLNDMQRISPPLSNATQAPAHISEEQLNHFHQAILQQLKDPQSLAHWLGQYMTESKYDDLHEALEEPLEWEDLVPVLEDAGQLVQNETSRWAYFYRNEDLHLYVNGSEFHIHSKEQHPLVKLLADNRRNNIHQLQPLLNAPINQSLLLELINQNFLYFDD